jgi:Escherichia/Staphylococcus phage prohead protease
METKKITRIEMKAEPAGEFTALIATFNKRDKYGDVIRPGAFAASIDAWRTRGANVPVVFSHRSDDVTQYIGHVEPQDLEETSIGLQARGRFYLDEPIAEKCFKQLQRKALNEWSFGFRIPDGGSHVLANGMRELRQITLLELGPCLAGVGDTATLEVKAEARRVDLLAERQALARVSLEPLRAQLEVAQYRRALTDALRPR